MIYRLVHFGGPDDGLEVLSPRPYSSTRGSDGTVYAAPEGSADCLRWESDTMQRIELHHVGRMSNSEYINFIESHA